MANFFTEHWIAIAIVVVILIVIAIAAYFMSGADNTAAAIPADTDTLDISSAVYGTTFNLSKLNVGNQTAQQIAAYGAGKNDPDSMIVDVDVTDIMRSNINNNCINLNPKAVSGFYTTLFGSDPAPNANKELIVSYTIGGGQSNTVTFLQDSPIKINVAPGN